MNAGLLGRTLGHSLSPQVHRLFGDYDYRLYAREPDDVADFLRDGFSAGTFDFLNVTIPYKQTVFALCDDLTPVARRLGNVNFVRRDAAGRLVGDNTDAFGVERLLDSAGADVSGLNCAILGAGGAAMTVRAVLDARGARRVAFIRRGERPAPDDELIVNATPVGMFPDVNGVRIDARDYPNCRFVLDLVYNPSPTRLVREARACGKTAVDGLVMLVAQASRAAQLAFPALSAPLRPLYLYGPPASGKSTLARQVAAATGWRLVDLDAEIEQTAGRTIPEIFAAEGERGFRARERDALGACARKGGTEGQVVALGGGALLDPVCRRLAEESGRVVVLDCPLAVLQSRLAGGSRPLSADAERLAALVRSRASHYASFPRHIALPAR